jgi:hypothetical protein
MLARAPSLFYTLFNFETIVSAGCETIAQKTPAKYPEAKVTDNYNDFEYSLFGFALKTLE